LTALAADARLHFLISDGSTRIVSATQFRGATRDALLTAIILRSGSALRLVFDRSLRPVVTVALGLDTVGGRIIGGRVAIGCAYAAPLTASLPLAEPLPPGELARGTEQLAQEVVAGLPTPLADHHATSGYRSSSPSGNSSCNAEWSSRFDTEIASSE